MCSIVFEIEIVHLNITFCCASSGSSGRVRGAEKYEIYAGGHLLRTYFYRAELGHGPLAPWIRYCAPTCSVFRHATQFQQDEHTPV